MSVVPVPPGGFDIDVETLIVGAGACGMTAALAARQEGQDVLVVERDALPSGSTALSAGLIPAAGTRFQAKAGIEDTPSIFAGDIQRKAHGENRQDIVDLLAREAAPAIEWLADEFGFAFSLVDNFDYPGHTHRRMHGLPSRSGRELVDTLRAACEARDIPIACERVVDTIHVADDATIAGIGITLPDGTRETIGCGRLILASNGFGGARDMVRRFMPDIADALYFGHDGNRGEAISWGEAIGAAIRHPGAYQGHGNVAHPHGILISWAVITSGGFQVNREGERFWNEAQGYSEAARAVLAQPGGEAFSIFDGRIAGIVRQFEDFRRAEAAGAVRSAASIEELAGMLSIPAEALSASLGETVAARGEGEDRFGRPWSGVAPLEAPFCGVRVTGALFHTQGGLDVNEHAQVLREDGSAIGNLFAAGGAACGVSGAADSGYLSGNGLLSAIVLGRIAGAWRP